MAKIDRQLREDRALRDAARRLLEADLGLVKGDVQDRGVGQRAADLVGSESRDLAGKALDKARAHPGLVIGSVVALLLVLLRNPLLDLLIAFLEGDDDEAPEDRPQDREDEEFFDRAERAEPHDRSPGDPAN